MAPSLGHDSVYRRDSPLSGALDTQDNRPDSVLPHPGGRHEPRGQVATINPSYSFLETQTARPTTWVTAPA